MGAGMVALKNSVCRCFGQVAQHSTDVGQKAHVEHPVGFVEHQKLQTVQLGVVRSEMIEQAARRADDDVDAAAEGVFLGTHADAAEYGGG